MKDTFAREAIVELADRLGMTHISAINSFVPTQPRKGIMLHEERIALLEAVVAEMKEAARPVCKSCGQKIQDGFREGQIEQVAAEVSGKRTKANRSQP